MCDDLIKELHLTFYVNTLLKMSFITFPRNDHLLIIGQIHTAGQLNMQKCDIFLQASNSTDMKNIISNTK